MKKAIFIMIIMVSIHVSAQSKFVQQKIDQVEHNLIPFVPIKNFKPWNLYERMKFYNVKGVSIAVIKNYKVDWAKGYGFADTLKKQKVTTKTMFSAGSISKFVMAVGALKLVEDQKLSLNEPINNYLRSWKIKENEWSRAKPVTLKMLLSHTPGTSQSSYFGFTPGTKLPSITEILNGDPVAETRPVVVNSEPGKEFRYSGGGSMIAQMAIMDVTNQPFSVFCNQAIFAKLGMKSTTFEQPLLKKFIKNASWGYSAASWYKGMPYVYPQQAAAGLYTTPTDLAQVFIEVQKAYIGKGKILNRESAQLMVQPQASVSNGSYKEEIGVGPFLFQRSDNTSQKGKYFEFTGVNAGFLAYGIGSVEDGNGVVIMLNSGDDVNGLGKEIRRSVAKTYGWFNFLPEEVVPVNIGQADLNAMAGRYRSGVDEVITMKVEDNYLVEQFNGGNPIYCFPIAKDSIVFSDYNIKGVFGKDENGVINSLRNEYQDKPMPKMSADEFAPHEFLKLKNYEAAKLAYRTMKMNEYQITYLIYEALNKKNLDIVAIKTLLELASEQHPESSIVNSRWGDYYVKCHDTKNALFYYKRALESDPENKEIKANISKLSH